MTKEEHELVDMIAENIRTTCTNYRFDRVPPDKDAEMVYQMTKIAFQRYINQGISFDPETNMIVFSDEIYFSVDQLPMVPLLLDDIQCPGEYEVKVHDKVIGKVRYSIPTEPPIDGHIIRIGQKAEFQFYDTVQMIKINIDLNNEVDDDDRK